MNKHSKKRTDGTSKNNWRTPLWLWEELHGAFNFEVDGASDGTNNLLPNYHTKETASIKRIADALHSRVFINPPFNELSTKNNKWIDDYKWLQRYSLLQSEAEGHIKFTCFLIRHAPETKHWQNWVWPYCDVFVFNKRINYVDPETGEIMSGVEFPSALAVYSSEKSMWWREQLGHLGCWVSAMRRVL